MDARDKPTGEILERTALLLPQKPDAPTQLRAENQGKLITLFWRYIPPNENFDDKVIRFEAYRIDPLTNTPQILNKKVVLRNNALFEYSLTFEVPTLGQTEQLYVRSLDITGQYSEPSTILRFDAQDEHAPNVVLNVSTNAISNDRVQINWDIADLGQNDSDVAGFNVYRSASLHNFDEYVKINYETLSANASVYNDTLTVVSGSQAYFYRVAAVDASGNEGPLSTAAMALVEDHTPPPAPSGLRAALSENGTVELTWDDKPSTTDFSTFIILRQRLSPYAPQIPFRVNQSSLLESSFEDLGEAGKGFHESSTYRYTLLSADKAGNFSPGATVEISIPDVTPPGSPNGVQGLIENSSRIALFWNPSSATDVMSYIVYRRETGSSKLVAIPAPAHTRRFEDTNVVVGTSYEYWVTAADSAGNESAQSEPFHVFMRDYSPPRSVRNVRVTPQADGSMTLAWEPVSAFDMAGYRVYRAQSIAGSYQPLNEALITENQWSDNASGSGSCYRIVAIDTSGNESKSHQPTCAPLAEFSTSTSQ